jgi:hypothetical protein
VQAAIEEIETELTSSGFLTTEEDGSVSNEGVLGIAELSSNGVRVTSNTDGAAGFAITGGNGITLGWTLGSNGGGVTINATNGLPNQATYAGKFLTTNGTTASWAEAVPNNSVSFSKLSTYNTAINGYVMGYSGTYGLVWTLPPTGLPTQATHSGKYLTTNGTAAAWNSLAAVAASGSYTDLTNKPTIPSSSGASGLVQLSNGSGQFTSDANIAFNTAANILTTDTIKVTTEAYSASGWDGDVSVPTKDAIRDKIESMASSYDYYFVNDNTSLTAGVDKYINIFTTANNTGSTIYAIIDMHIDYGYGTYTHVSGNFSSDFNANAITRQNWTVQYTDYVTSNITILPELIDNGISSTFRIKLNSPVTSTHHYVLSIKYLHK